MTKGNYYYYEAKLKKVKTLNQRVFNALFLTAFCRGLSLAIFVNSQYIRAL